MGRRIIVTGLILALGLLSVSARAAQDAAAPYLGKWGITIADTGDSFNAGWLRVFRKPDGALGGELLWRWGSVVPVKSATLENGELKVVRTESAEDPKTKKPVPVDVTYAMKLTDGKLVGSVKGADGKVYNFAGVPATEKTDVSGTWDIDLMVRQSRIEKRKLTLKQEGDKLSGTWEGDGLSAPIKNPKLDGGKLTFTFEWGSPVNATAEFKGEKVGGTAQVAFSGERQRKAGPEVVLFDGKDLKGWHSREAKETPPRWEIKDGYLTPLKGAADLCSDQKFEDFKLHAEWYFPEKGGNSGVYPRGLYEVQLQDDYGKPLEQHICGSIYSRIAPTKNACKPINNWQTCDLTLVGRWITVAINGETVVDNQHLDGITGGAISADENAPGPIVLQAHGQAVRFRNVRLTPLLK